MNITETPIAISNLGNYISGEAVEIPENNDTTKNVTENIDPEPLITTTAENTLNLTTEEVPVNNNATDTTETPNSNSEPIDEVENSMNITETPIAISNLGNEAQNPTTPANANEQLPENTIVAANLNTETIETVNMSKPSIENTMTNNTTNENSEVSNDVANESMPLPITVNVHANESTDMLHNKVMSANNILEKLKGKIDENIEEKTIENPFE